MDSKVNELGESLIHQTMHSFLRVQTKWKSASNDFLTALAYLN